MTNSTSERRLIRKGHLISFMAAPLLFVCIQLLIYVKKLEKKDWELIERGRRWLFVRGRKVMLIVRVSRLGCKLTIYIINFC